MTRESYLIILTATLFLLSCKEKTTTVKESTPKTPIIGTWRLISGMTIEKGDTVFSDYTKNQSVIKIINETHFAFLRHDLVKGKDSTAIFVSGGGPYSLDGNKYTEQLEYCNYREWEGHSFDFIMNLSNDTLIQSGVEKVVEAGVDRITIEKYIKK